MIKLKEKIFSILLYLAIFGLLSYGFIYFVADLFTYVGFIYIENSTNTLISICVLLFLTIFTPQNFNNKFSVFYFHLTMILLIIPMAVLCAFGGKSLLFFLEIAIAYLFSIACVTRLPQLNIRFKTLSYSKYANLLLLISIATIASITIIGGVSNFNLDIARVYEFRKDAADNLPIIFSYILPVLGKVVLPITLVLFLKEKKYAFACIVITCNFLLFGLTAHKSVAFFAILLLFIYFLLSAKKVIIKLQLSIIVILSISIIGTLTNMGGYSDEGFLFASLFLRRGFIVPADLNFSYFDFFNTEPFVFWSNSKLSLGLLEYPYSYDIPNLIGGYRFDRFDNSANTGWSGSGYAHAGFLGMLVYSLIISFILVVIDSIAIYADDAKLVIAAATIPMLTIISSSDLPTALFTHGVLFSILLMLLLPRRTM